MAAYNKTIITAKGQALIAKSMVNTDVAFTRVVTSDKDYTSKGNLENLTSIDNIKQSELVSEIKVLNRTAVQVVSAFSNSLLTTGYYLRTIGLYATDPDEGEILYSITTALVPDWIPPFGNISITSFEVKLETIVSNSGNIDLNVSPTAVVNVSQFKEFKEQVVSQLSEIEQHIDGLINVRLFGAKGDGITDDTEAIKQALKQSGIIFLPKGNYLIKDTLVVEKCNTLKGSGRNITNIIMDADDRAIIKVKGSYITISDISLKRSKYSPPTNINANGIEVESSSYFDHSVLEKLSINSNYSAIKCVNTSFYSNTVRDIWIQGYKNWAIDIEGTGNTGCIFSNIYTTNWDNYLTRTKNIAKGTFLFKGFSESFASQLNVEHTRNNYGIYINSSENFSLDSIHFEGYEENGDYNAMIISLASNITVQSATCSFCGIAYEMNNKGDIYSYKSQSLSLFGAFGGGKIYANGVTTRSNMQVQSGEGAIRHLPYGSAMTWKANSYYSVEDVVYVNNRIYKCVISGTTSNTAPTHSSGNAIDGTCTWQYTGTLSITFNIVYNNSPTTYIDDTKVEIINHYDKDGLFTRFTGLVAHSDTRTHQIKRYNDKLYYDCSYGGKVNNYFLSSLPTIGKWFIGDTIFNNSPIASGYSGWKCIGSGIFGNNDTGIKATTIAYSSAIILSASSGLNDGDRITIDGIEYTIFTCTSNIYNDNHINITPNPALSLTNVVVKFAKPEFKQFGLLE